MKNICFLIGNLNNAGGTERVTSLIANKLSESNRYRITILSLWEGKQPFFPLHKNIVIGSLYDVKPSFKKNFIPTTIKIRNFVKSNNVNILIDVDSILCVFTVPALIGLTIKHICWEHFNFNANLGVKLRDIGRKLAARHCDYVITLTKRDKELWEHNLNNIKAEIIPIPNPTPYENIENTPRLEYKTVLAMGRLTYQKGFDLLIEAWANVCKKNNDWTLRIVGSGEDEIILKQQASRLNINNRIDFVPATKDVEKYYKSSSFYCLSSRFEGLPMVLLEAQAYGLPIISFNCDTGPAEVIKDSENGYLCNADDVGGLEYILSKSINQLSANDYEKLHVNALKTNKNFYISNLIEKWYSIL